MAERRKRLSVFMRRKMRAVSDALTDYAGRADR